MFDPGKTFIPAIEIRHDHLSMETRQHLKQVVRREVVDRLDHTYINDLIDNPTAEVMAVWIWNALREPLSGLAEVELWETRNCAVVYRGE